MALHDITPPVKTDQSFSARLARQLTRNLAMTRTCLERVKVLLDKAPGGKAAICTNLGATDCQEAVDIIASQIILVNAHLPTGISALTAPLVQADVPS